MSPIVRLRGDRSASHDKRNFAGGENDTLNGDTPDPDDGLSIEEREQIVSTILS